MKTLLVNILGHKMSVLFGLKNTQVWVRMILLLLLYVSICLHAGYAHAEEDEGPLLTSEEKLDNDENYNSVQANDEESEDEEEEDFLEDNTTTAGVEQVPSENLNEEECIPEKGRCPKREGALQCCKSDPPLKCEKAKMGTKFQCVK